MSFCENTRWNALNAPRFLSVNGRKPMRGVNDLWRELCSTRFWYWLVQLYTIIKIEWSFVPSTVGTHCTFWMTSIKRYVWILFTHRRKLLVVTIVMAGGRITALHILLFIGLENNHTLKVSGVTWVMFFKWNLTKLFQNPYRPKTVYKVPVLFIRNNCIYVYYLHLYNKFFKNWIELSTFLVF